ncbi:MAG: AAA family ATPase [Lachnospiraceae bacterium]|nr:AAA family ATPase [Lachnospiraceae bacterium]
MKRILQLLKPDVRKGYIKREENESERSKPEKFKYLHVSSEYGEDTLENDIAAGALQYRNCLDHLRNGEDVHFSIIQCDTKEEGLNAITYMEAYRGFEYSDEDCDDIENEEYGELEFDNNLLILNMREIKTYENRNNDLPFGTDYSMRTDKEYKTYDPFWTEYSGKVIIVDHYLEGNEGNTVLLNHDQPYNSFGMEEFEKNKWHKFFERFSDNGCRIYYLLVRTEGLYGLFEEPSESVGSNEEGSGVCIDPFRSISTDFSLCKLILKYTADMIKLEADTKDKENYYITLFRQYIKDYGFITQKRFPLRKTVRNICFMDSGPSESMDMVLRYIKHKYKDIKVISSKIFNETGVLNDVIKSVDEKKEKDEIKMDDLVGMEEVKKQFENIIKTIKFNIERREKGLPTLDYRNIFLLIGAPGTAKTTMANILGRRMKEEHLLKGTKFGSFSGAQLKGAFVGQTAPLVHSIFEKHDIILIDEAYSLTASYRGSMDTYSQEALAQLAIELENHGKDRLIFFAGYGGTDISDKNNKMKEFLDANPGIKSRINGTIVFPSYNKDQMYEIVKCIALRYGYTFEDRALDPLTGYFEERVKDENFGNGREARSFVDNCQMTLAERVMKLPENRRTKKIMQLITKEDVEETIERLNKSYKSQGGKRVRYGFL